MSIEHWSKWISVFFFSMVKFVGGPLTGIALGLTVWETVIFTVLGMMTSVLLFSWGGLWIRNQILPQFHSKKKRIFTANKRRIIKVWSKYGLPGVAFLTPLLFTPIGGTMVVVSFGVPIKKILPVMFLTAVFWAVILTYGIHFFGEALGLLN